MKQDILNLDNKNVGTIELNDSVFGLEVRADILHRVVLWQLARQQAGTHQTKGRSDATTPSIKPLQIRKLLPENGFSTYAQSCLYSLPSLCKSLLQ